MLLSVVWTDTSFLITWEDTNVSKDEDCGWIDVDGIIVLFRDGIHEYEDEDDDNEGNEKFSVDDATDWVVPLLLLLLLRCNGNDDEDANIDRDGMEGSIVLFDVSCVIDNEGSIGDVVRRIIDSLYSASGGDANSLSSMAFD